MDGDHAEGSRPSEDWRVLANMPIADFNYSCLLLFHPKWELNKSA